MKQIPGEWSNRAACVTTKGIDPNIFMPELGDNAQKAKDICDICPVRAECLQLSIENKEQYGIWGKHSVKERRKLFKPYFKLKSQMKLENTHPTPNDVLRLESLYISQ